LSIDESAILWYDEVAEKNFFKILNLFFKFHVNNIRSVISQKRERRSAVFEDHNLIKQILQGDNQAFDTLVRKHYSNIYSYCYRRMGNEHTAADLTQDIFLKLVEVIYKYRFNGKFSNFLFTIAVNTCNDYLRKMRPQSDIDLDSILDTKASPLDSIIRDEEFGKLRSLLYTLPDMQREALILHYCHGLKAKDVAKITGVSLPTAKSRIKQGLDKLKKIYGKGDDYERD